MLKSSTCIKFLYLVVFLTVSISTIYAAEWKGEIKDIDRRNYWLENYDNFKKTFYENNWDNDKEKLKEQFIELSKNDDLLSNTGQPGEGRIAAYYDFAAAANILESFWSTNNSNQNPDEKSGFLFSNVSLDGIRSNLKFIIEQKKKACENDTYCYREKISLYVSVAKSDSSLGKDFFINGKLNTNCGYKIEINIDDKKNILYVTFSRADK